MERLVLLSHILHRVGVIQGNKSFQKLIYLIQSSDRYLGYDYRWISSGPVSTQLERDIEEAVSLGIITRIWHEGFPIYSPNANIGSSYIKAKLAATYLPDPVNLRLTKIVELFDRENIEPKKLEIMASLDYLQHSKQYDLEEAKMELILQSDQFTTTELDYSGIQLMKL